jgi:hypothetical protein
MCVCVFERALQGSSSIPSKGPNGAVGIDKATTPPPRLEQHTGLRYLSPHPSTRTRYSLLGSRGAVGLPQFHLGRRRRHGGGGAPLSLSSFQQQPFLGKPVLMDGDERACLAKKNGSRSAFRHATRTRREREEPRRLLLPCVGEAADFEQSAVCARASSSSSCSS